MLASGVALGIGLVGLALGFPTPAVAGDLTSASYRHRGGAAVAAAATRLESAGPRFGASGVSVGGPGPVGWSGADGDLTTSAEGFWPIVVAEAPSLDVDGDGVPSYLDVDDDGDGLADAVETGTGVFVSPDDTGTDPVNSDSDGDGFGDGSEVASGSDPNDAASTPPAVPLLSWPLAALLVAVLAATSRPRRSVSEEE